MFECASKFVDEIINFLLNKNGPTVIAIESTNWQEISIALIEKVKKVTNFNFSFGKSLHFIVFPPTKSGFFEPNYECNPESEIKKLPFKWPLLMEGIHRIDIIDYKLIFHIVFGIDSWSKISAQIDIIVADSLQSQALRVASPEALLATYDGLEEVQDLVHAKQYKIISSEDIPNSHKLYKISNPHRPQIIPVAKPSSVAIIGAGIAGASIANELASRGHKVDIYDPKFAHMPVGEALETSAGAITPVITADDSPKSRISRAGVLRAYARWQCFFDHQISPCGTLEVDRDKGYAKSLAEAVEILNFPKDWIRRVTAQEASEISGFHIKKDAVFLPYGMQISPLKMINALLERENISTQAQYITAVKPSSGGKYILCGNDDFNSPEYEYVVIATAIDTPKLLASSGLDFTILKSGHRTPSVPKFETMHALSGETLRVPSQMVNGGPKCIIGGLGYFLPQMGGYCVMGSTYKHGEMNPQLTAEGEKAILSKIPVDFEFTADELIENQGLRGHACIRAVINGRTPIIGRLKGTNVFLACAYASHGMTWASLGAEIIATEIAGEPAPLTRDLLKIMAPEST